MAKIGSLRLPKKSEKLFLRRRPKKNCAGNRYAKIDGDFSKSNSKYLYPIKDVYFWLGIPQKSPITFADMQDKVYWKKAIETMQSKGTESIDGKSCEVYSLSNDNLDVTIWLSKDDHGLPIQSQVENKKLKHSIKTTVTKVAAFDKNISIPQSILITNPRGEKHCELAMEKSSVNAKIDSSIFNIAQPGKDVYKNAPNQ